MRGKEAEEFVRVVAAEVAQEEREFDAALRPRWLSEFVGQGRIKEQLELLIESARGRGETLDHVLLSGPPGLGKTTLAGIVANELGVGFRPTSGPAVERVPELQFQRPAAEVELSYEDAQRRGVQNGAEVTVSTNEASVRLRARVSRRFPLGLARVAEEHAGDLGLHVEVAP